MDSKKVGIGIGLAVLVAVVVGAIFLFLPKEEEEVFYKVTFNNEGVTTVVDVQAGKLVVEPIEPEKEGYTFEGWYYNGTKFNFTTGITSDMTLIARWTEETAKKWVVTFDTAGGNHIEKLNVVDGEKIEEVPTPKKEGYKFLGWYYNEKEYDFDTKVTKDITLLAKWEKVETKEEVKVTKYTVKFETDGGNKVPSVTVEENKTIVKPADPIKEGYKFLGWYNGKNKFDFATKITKNITLTAKWEKIETPSEPLEPKTYSVTFDTAGGSAIPSLTVKEGETITKPNDPTKEGYTFIGWYYNDTLYNFSTEVTSDVTLAAKWEKNAVISYVIEETDSYVGQVKIFVVREKDDVKEKVAGIIDIVTNNGKTVKDKEIPKEGYVTNGDKVKEVINVRVK